MRKLDLPVIALPGHASGLIGLFRDSNRLALVSDRLADLDPAACPGHPDPVTGDGSGQLREAAATPL